MTPPATFSVMISHYQLVVFDPSLDEPFNDWHDRHVSQGFAWRPGSVSFRTMDSVLEQLTVEISIDPIGLDPSVVRAIDVPFDVPAAGRVEIGGLFDSKVFEFAPGRYQLGFECRADGLRLAFRTTKAPVFRLVRVDPELEAEGVLLTTASPA